MDTVVSYVTIYEVSDLHWNKISRKFDYFVIF